MLVRVQPWVPFHYAPVTGPPSEGGNRSLELQTVVRIHAGAPTHADVAQRTERPPPKREVGGWNPPVGARIAQTVDRQIETG